MNDRDCDNCAHHSEGGCSVWECSFEAKEDDTISRQAAVDAICGVCQADCIPCEFDTASRCEMIKAIQALPSAQPERLTDDDWETIRIHLNAYKEKLCNLHRWEEAEEYQRIINRFMSFASAQPNLQPTCNNLATDTISRRAAMDALDNIKIPGNASWYPYYQQALTVMSRLPSAQPEIVRCKDCKDYQEGVDINGKPFSRCNGSVRTYGHTMPDWYCADAEMREE